MINQPCCTQSHELEGRGSIQIMNLLRTVNSNQLSVFMTRPAPYRIAYTVLGRYEGLGYDPRSLTQCAHLPVARGVEAS